MCIFNGLFKRNDKSKSRRKCRKKHIIKGCLIGVYAVLLAVLLQTMGGTARQSEAKMAEPLVYAEETKMPNELQLYAQAAVLMDADSGRVLYGKNEDEILPMASTTKIMTCIIALEYGNPEDIVQVSSYAAGMPKVKLDIREGERYYLMDLLYSLMLESHNDAAVAIAESIAGSVERFAVMMNQKARDIGCFDTYFITPNGLDAASKDGSKIHSTTAADLARIMAYCVTDSERREQFLAITGTREYNFQDISGKRSFHCSNHNNFLNMMDEAVSGKTGFTNKAGYCYVGAIESEGRTYTVALLACGWPNNKNYKWSDMRKLANYGMEYYTYRDIYEEQTFESIPVANGIAGRSATPYDQAYMEVALAPSTQETLPYLLCDKDRIEVKKSLDTELEAPLKAGEKVGQVAYYLNGELIREDPVLTTKEIKAQDYPWIFSYILQRYLL